MGIDSTVPDSSKLLFIDKYVNANKGRITVLEEAYPHIVALIGELLIKYLDDAEWDMQNDEVSGIIEPYVVTSSSRSKESIPAFLIVYKEMFEYDKCALLEHVRIYVSIN